MSKPFPSDSHPRGPSKTPSPRARALGAPAGAATLVALVLLGAAGCGQQGPQPLFVCGPPVGDSPVRGPTDAWVTIVEHADFACPACASLQPVLKQIESTYADDARVVFKYLPLSFHERAMPAAIAAECAHEQGKFWPVHDELFAGGDLSEAGLQAAATDAGVDIDAWQLCRQGTEAANRVQADIDLANVIGVTGTPTLFINGVWVLGVRPFEDLQSIVDTELDQARSSGIAAADYYEQSVAQCPVPSP